MVNNSCRQQKIGIMGGTFNPIHNGHLALAQHALGELSLDSILFIPSGISWLKADQDVLDASIRAEMTRLAIEDEPLFQLSLVEVEREGNSYSYETVLALKQKNPNTDFYFIMGADSVLSLHKWIHPEILLRECTILAAVRDDCDSLNLVKQIRILEKEYNAEIIPLSMPKMDISSSKIRAALQRGESIHGLVPESVEMYINTHKLYLG